jgi:hypothetical protein
MTAVASGDLEAALHRFDAMVQTLLAVESNTPAQKAEIVAIAWALRMAVLNMPTSVKAMER